jgi:kinesin family protein C2/C3
MSAKPKSSPPPPVADEDCVEYIVSRRPDKNSSTGELEYKVHWTGTDITEDEWFLRGALVNDYPDMLTAYDRKEDDRLAKKRADAAKASQAAKAAKAAELAKAAESKRRQRAEESRKVLTKLNGEVERLENEADGLRRDLFDVREDRDSLARKVKRLRTDYEQAESHIARLKGELATESDDTAKLRHKVRALQSDCAKLEREQSKMTAAAEIAARDMQESRDAETVAHSANQTALAEATEAHARALRRAEERAARAEEALRKEVAARVERMRALDASEQSLDKIRGVLVEEEQKVSALQARLTVVEEEHQNSQRRAGAQAKEIAQAQARVAELEAEAANAAAAVQATAKETPPPAPAAPVPAVAPALPPKLAEEAADSLRAKVSAQVREQCEAEFTRALESREKTHADEKVQLAARHQEALRHLTSANEEKLAALATAEKKLAERARERARAESQAAAAADAEQSRLKSEELAEKVSKLKKTNAALKGLLEDAQLEMEQRSGRVSALEALLQEAKEKESAEVEKMQRKMDVFEAELSRETEARIEKHAEAARAEAKASIDRIQRKLEAVQEKFRSEVATRRKLHERVMELEGNIRVFCRSRPVLAVDGSGEYAQVVVSCATVDGEVAERIDEAAGPLKVLRLKFDEVATTRRVDAEFEFESVFPKGVQQTDVYEKIRPFVISAVDGYDVCLFAYGQTGSGKTFTMEGGGTRDYGSVDAQKVQTDDGIYARALETMFDEARSRAQACGTMAYEFQISMTEIYMEEVFDLLKASEGDGGGSATGA